MSEAEPVHHSINYIEFSVTDMEIAKEFYSQAFGWEFTDYGPSYVGIQKSGGGECGGFALVDQVSTGGPLVILYSSSLEESLASVVTAGGKTTRDIFEFPGGRRFQFLDPSGNELAVWSEN